MCSEKSEILMDISKNKTIVITAPSGAGKTTIVRHLLSKYSDILDFSVSATTRTKRDYEINGRDYYFISKEEFKLKIENDAFVEWQEVYEDQFYGTLKSEVERLWKLNKVIIFDIDVKGATNLKKYFGDNCLSIFVSPPGIDVLIERLKNRGTESPKSLKKRISRVKTEMNYCDKFNKVLINGELEIALVEAERLVEEFLNK